MRSCFVYSALAVFTALPAGNAFAADSQLLNLVMPDAQVMAGTNVTNAETSPLGSFILAHLSGDQSLQQLISKTGFDPRKDVTEMLAASNGSAASASSLVLAKGTFDVAKIVAAAQGGKLQQVSTYNGATLITSASASAKDNQAVAFIGGSIAVMGDISSVKAAVDRSAAVNSINPALAVQVQALSTTEDAWSVSLASIGSLIPGALTSSADGMATQVLQLFKNIQSSSGGVKFGSTVRFTAQATADSPQDASSLADVIKMVASLAAMNAGGNSSNKDAAALAQFMQSLQVSTSGASVNLSASVPETQVEAILSSVLAPRAAAGMVKPSKM